MQKDFYKYISFSIIFLSIIIPNTKSEEEINQGGNGRRDDDDRHPDFMKILIDLKEEIQNISKDIAKYDTLIYLLVPGSCLLFLIILSISIYEIIKCCKKNDGNSIETTENGLYLYSKNNSKLKTSSTDSSSPQESQNNELKNSFNSSKMTESNISKDILKSGIYGIQNSKRDYYESNKGEYVAPSIMEVNDNQQRNDEKEKYFTNDGN